MEVHTFISTLSTSKIVEFYNKYNPEKPVKKFTDRKTAEERLMKVCVEKGFDTLDKLTGVKIEEVKAPSPQETIIKNLDDKADEKIRNEASKVVTKIANKYKTNQKLDKPPKEKGWLPGPKSKLDGHRFYKLVEVNPRRENSIGWGSWNRLKNGMTYKEYISAGGRRVDLAWEIRHGHVEMRSEQQVLQQSQTA